MAKRLFVAIPISESLQGQILGWEERFKERAKIKFLPIRWLTGKNLHVTLIPPWHEENTEEVRRSLDSVEAEPFDIEFKKVGYGPNPRIPRLIWTEGKAPENMLALKNKLEHTLGVKGEFRKFRMHLTLARFNEDEFSRFPLKEIKETVSWRDSVKSCVLMESHPSPQGADYEIIHEVKLG